MSIVETSKANEKRSNPLNVRVGMAETLQVSAQDIAEMCNPEIAAESREQRLNTILTCESVDQEALAQGHVAAIVCEGLLEDLACEVAAHLSEPAREELTIRADRAGQIAARALLRSILDTTLQPARKENVWQGPGVIAELTGRGAEDDPVKLAFTYTEDTAVNGDADSGDVEQPRGQVKDGEANRTLFGLGDINLMLQAEGERWRRQLVSQMVKRDAKRHGFNRKDVTAVAEPSMLEGWRCHFITCFSAPPCSSVRMEGEQTEQLEAKAFLAWCLDRQLERSGPGQWKRGAIVAELTGEGHEGSPVELIVTYHDHLGARTGGRR